MSLVINPRDVAPPFSRYAQGILSPEGCRWLHVPGQVGVRPNGAMAMTPEAQLEQAFANLLAVLAEADTGREHLVKLNVFLTREDDIGLYRTVRDRVLEGQETASTLLVVAALASPDFLVEIDAVAAAPSV
jgi:2-iminobutanoate/2-iminopropanoate deaminase